jgi:hypothetical protein
MSNASGSEYNPLETELDDGSDDSVGHQDTKLSTSQKKHDKCMKKGDSEFRRQHHGDQVDEESDDGSHDNFCHQNNWSTTPKNYNRCGQRGEPEFQRNYYGDQQDDELQQQLYELKEKSRKLQVELRKLNAAGSWTTKLDLQSLSVGWPPRQPWPVESLSSASIISSPNTSF